MQKRPSTPLLEMIYELESSAAVENFRLVLERRKQSRSQPELFCTCTSPAMLYDTEHSCWETVWLGVQSVVPLLLASKQAQWSDQQTPLFLWLSRYLSLITPRADDSGDFWLTIVTASLKQALPEDLLVFRTVSGSTHPKNSQTRKVASRSYRAQLE